MALTTNRNSDVFLEFMPKRESQLFEMQAFVPLTHALIIVKYDNRFLLIFNRYKNYWELPGGMIEKDETPFECVIRELQEETNQVVSNPILKGIMKFQLASDARIEFGALYFSELSTQKEFLANDEADRIVLWDRIADIGYVDEIDSKLLDFA